MASSHAVAKVTGPPVLVASLAAPALVATSSFTRPVAIPVAARSDPPNANGSGSSRAVPRHRIWENLLALLPAATTRARETLSTRGLTTPPGSSRRWPPARSTSSRWAAARAAPSSPTSPSQRSPTPTSIRSTSSCCNSTNVLLGFSIENVEKTCRSPLFCDEMLSDIRESRSHGVLIFPAQFLTPDQQQARFSLSFPSLFREKKAARRGTNA